MSTTTTTMIQTNLGPMKAIHIHVPVGIPTADGGLEIPNRVFLGGIPNETTELELELFFSDYGVVKDVRIVTDRITGECKGYGFVTFDENEDISNLLKKQNIIMKGKKLRVRKAIRRNSSQFKNSDSGGSSSESSPVPTTSPPPSQQQPQTIQNKNNANNAEINEPVLFVPSSPGGGGSVFPNGQPLTYQHFNFPSQGTFIPVGPPPPPQHQTQYQQLPPYQPIQPQTCQPIYFVPYNGSMPPHHQGGYGYPLY